MASTQTAGAHTAWDASIHLQHQNLVKYPKGQLIYDAAYSTPGFYRVVDGMVKVSRRPAGEYLTVVDIYQRGEVFGESVFLPVPPPFEQAAAFSDTRLMSWTRQEIFEIVSQQPQVAVELIRAIVERAAEFTERIESLCTEDTESRLKRTLIRLANRMGSHEPNGSIRLPPLTHELLSQFVGTTREHISLAMNHLRRGGYISYSRKGISVQSRAALDWNASRTGGPDWVRGASI